MISGEKLLELNEEYSGRANTTFSEISASLVANNCSNVVFNSLGSSKTMIKILSNSFISGAKL
jgi:hypothetical protein